MAARLLLDENLSERLLPLLIDLFPGSTHVRGLGRGGAPDTSVWEMARGGGYLLVTRDEDFVGMSVLRGSPPKVVWLNIGNARCVHCSADPYTRRRYRTFYGARRIHLPCLAIGLHDAVTANR